MRPACADVGAYALPTSSPLTHTRSHRSSRTQPLPPTRPPGTSSATSSATSPAATPAAMCAPPSASRFQPRARPLRSSRSASLVVTQRLDLPVWVDNFERAVGKGDLLQTVLEMALHLLVREVVELHAIWLRDVRRLGLGVVVDHPPVDRGLLDVTVGEEDSLQPARKHLLARACRIENLGAARSVSALELAIWMHVFVDRPLRRWAHARALGEVAVAL
mmetsp:Transcript_23999/g.52416  ORF Transcript_23999/g.52416 Transcript_23999/m.52416 type:complete len:219 (+) Transcript_23999:337-993(+)